MMKQQSDTKSKSLESNFPFHQKEQPPPLRFVLSTSLSSLITYGWFLVFRQKNPNGRSSSSLRFVAMEQSFNFTRQQLPVVMLEVIVWLRAVLSQTTRLLDGENPGWEASVCQWLIKMFLAVLIRCFFGKRLKLNLLDLYDKVQSKISQFHIVSPLFPASFLHEVIPIIESKACQRQKPPQRCCQHHWHHQPHSNHR